MLLVSPWLIMYLVMAYSISLQQMHMTDIGRYLMVLYLLPFSKIGWTKAFFHLHLKLNYLEHAHLPLVQMIVQK